MPVCADVSKEGEPGDPTQLFFITRRTRSSAALLDTGASTLMDPTASSIASTLPPATSDVNSGASTVERDHSSAAAVIPRRDKSLSALSHELIQRYGQDGTVIDLDEVQVDPHPIHITMCYLTILTSSPPTPPVQTRFPNWKKRRLYDVMSICQCLRVVERSCKSQFVWRGITRVQAAVYEFLLRDMAIRPILDGHTELDPDEPAVPVTGLAFLCQQFVLLLRQRALDNQAAAIGLEEATQQLCQRVKSTDDKTVRTCAAERISRRGRR